MDQHTEYLYEDPYNAALVTNTIYPDSSDTNSSGTDQVKLSYNLDGSLDRKTDQREVTILYLYAIDRKLRREYAATIPGGSGVDDRVRSLNWGYDGLGRIG